MERKIECDYTNFKIGQKVMCLNLNSSDESEFWKDRLVIGETYEVEDLEFRFPDRICVKLKGPHYFHSEFVPCWFFYDSLQEIRDKKIDEILS